MHRLILIAIIGLLAGCSAPPPPELQKLLLGPTGAAGEISFTEIAERVETVAEALCRERGVVRTCNFRILIDTRPDQPPNAFQTVDRMGRPLLGFSTALIAQARNPDELAFVMGHEAAHHIQGHIPLREQAALSGALMGTILATAQGLPETEIERAGQIGAELGARRFSKSFELEADALGTEIALRAGFNPVRGAAFFDRLPDPGDQFLGSHPTNAERKALVRATQKRLLAGG
jgi:predicted Zn-dependent protease